MFAPEAAPGPGGARALRELEEVLYIVEATDKAIRRGFLEPAWNDRVHARVLDLALQPFADRLDWNNM